MWGILLVGIPDSGYNVAILDYRFLGIGVGVFTPMS